MNQQVEIFNSEPVFGKYKFDNSNSDQDTLNSELFWLNPLCGDSVLKAAQNQTSATESKIENSLKKKMLNSQFDDKLLSGTFKFENLREFGDDTIFYYDIEMTTGNLS